MLLPVHLVDLEVTLVMMQIDHQQGSGKTILVSHPSPCLRAFMQTSSLSWNRMINIISNLY